MLSLVSALLQGDGASHMQAYSAAQLEGLAYLSINVYKMGWVTAQLFGQGCLHLRAVDGEDGRWHLPPIRPRRILGPDAGDIDARPTPWPPGLR